MGPKGVIYGPYKWSKTHGVIFHTFQVKRWSMNFPKIGHTYIWLQKRLSIGKPRLNKKTFQKENMKYIDSMWKKVSPGPCVFLFVFFWCLTSVGCLFFGGGFGDFLRGSPDIFPHGWQKSTCKGGHLDFISGISGTVKQLIPVIFDDPW